MIRLNLAGWVVSVEAEPPELAESLAARYAPFWEQGVRQPDMVVKVRQDGGGTQSHSLLQAPVIAKGEEYLLDGPEFYGIIGPFRGQATLSMRSAVPTREVEYFLRVTLALFALHRGGLLVHSAGVVDRDEAFLFIGQSGSGKSTVVSLSRAAGKTTALSDDLVVLRPDGEGWRAYGTPFWNVEAEGREGQTSSGRVSSIFKLIQSRDVYAEPMSAAASTAELLANCPIVNNEPALMPGLLERCRDIVKVVGMQRLHFRKDDAFWKILSC